jgi:hypothetical protein
LREQHDQDLSNYRNEKGAWECARDKATKGGKGIGQPSNWRWINWGRCPRRPSSPS